MIMAIGQCLVCLMDDPSLNVRLPGVQRQPLRVIADSRWRTPASARTLHLDGPVLIAGMAARPVPEGLAGAGAELLRLPGEGEHVDLASLMKELAAREVNDVHVEAGGALCGALLSARLVDEVLIYQAPTLLGGEALPSFVWPSLERMEDRPQMSLQDVRHLGPDLRIRLQPQYPEV